MRIILRYGLILGAAVGAYNLGLALAGAFTNNLLGFWAVLAIELVGAIWILRRTAREGWRYWRQVGAATLAFAVAAVVLFFATYTTLSRVTPDYADVIVDAQRQRVLAGGDPPPDLEARLDRLRDMYTPIRQASFVVPATIVTGLLYALGGAVFYRATGPR